MCVSLCHLGPQGVDLRLNARELACRELVDLVRWAWSYVHTNAHTHPQFTRVSRARFLALITHRETKTETQRRAASCPPCGINITPWSLSEETRHALGANQDTPLVLERGNLTVVFSEPSPE